MLSALGTSGYAAYSATGTGTFHPVEFNTKLVCTLKSFPSTYWLGQNVDMLFIL